MSWTHLLSACPLWEVSHRVQRGDNGRFTSKHVAEIELNAAVTNLCPSNLKMILSLPVTTATYFNMLILITTAVFLLYPFHVLLWACMRSCACHQIGLQFNTYRPSQQASSIDLLVSANAVCYTHRFWAEKKKNFHFHINGNYLISICLALYPYIQYPVENTLTKLNILEEQKT